MPDSPQTEAQTEVQIEQEEWNHLRAVFHKVSKDEDSFGLYKLFRIFLALFRYMDPVYHVMDYTFRKKGTKNAARIAGDYAFVSRFGVLIFLYLVYGINRMFFHPNQFINWLYVRILWLIPAYFLVTIFFGLLGVILLHDVYHLSFNKGRSLFFSLWQYVEATLGFGLLYAIIGEFSLADSSRINNSIGLIQSVYFSFLISATLGSSDILPSNLLTKVIVICHILTTLVVVTVVITFFSSDPNVKHQSNK